MDKRFFSHTASRTSQRYYLNENPNKTQKLIFFMPNSRPRFTWYQVPQLTMPPGRRGGGSPPRRSKLTSSFWFRYCRRGTNCELRGTGNSRLHAATWYQAEGSVALSAPNAITLALAYVMDDNGLEGTASTWFSNLNMKKESFGRRGKERERVLTRRRGEIE
jgi:hypothetical protein